MSFILSRLGSLAGLAASFSYDLMVYSNNSATRSRHEIQLTDCQSLIFPLQIRLILSLECKASLIKDSLHTDVALQPAVKPDAFQTFLWSVRRRCHTSISCLTLIKSSCSAVIYQLSVQTMACYLSSIAQFPVVIAT